MATFYSDLKSKANTSVKSSSDLRSKGNVSLLRKDLLSKGHIADTPGYAHLLSKGSITYPGLIAQWKLNEGYGTVAKNSFNTGDGTVNGIGADSGAEWASGKDAGDVCLNFKGGDGLVNCGTNAALNVRKNFVISAWVNPADYGNYASGGINYGFGRIVDKAKILFYMNGKGTSVSWHFPISGVYYSSTLYRIIETLGMDLDGVNLVPQNVWTHVAMTFDGYNIKLYINGQWKASLSVGADVNIDDHATNPFIIGNALTLGRAFQGKIQDVRVYNQLVSPDSILGIANEKVLGSRGYILHKTAGYAGSYHAYRARGGYMLGSKYTLSEEASCYGILVRLSGWDHYQKAKCALYKVSDNSLVAQTEEKEHWLSSADNDEHWYYFPFTTPVHLKPEDYWFMTWGERVVPTNVFQEVYDVTFEDGDLNQLTISDIPYTGNFPATLTPEYEDSTAEQKLGIVADYILQPQQDLQSKGNLVAGEGSSIELDYWNLQYVTINDKNLLSKGYIPTPSPVQDLQSRGNIKIVVDKDLQSKANLSTTSRNNLLSKGSISVSSFKDLRSKGSIKTIVYKDLQSKAGLSRTSTVNLLSKGNVKTSSFKNILSRANLSATAYKNLLTKGSVSNTLFKNLQSKANVWNSSWKDLRSKGNVSVKSSSNLLSKGNLSNKVSKTLQSKGALSNTLFKDLQSKGKLFISYYADLRSKGNIPPIAGYGNLLSRANISVVNEKDLESKANLSVSSFKNLQSKASLFPIRYQNLQTKGNVKVGNLKDLQSKANLSTTSFKDLRSKAGLSSTQYRNLQSKANLKIVNYKTLQSKANLSASPYKDLESKANLKAVVSKQLQSRANLSTKLQKDLRSKANLKISVSADLQSKGRLFKAYSQDLQSKGSIQTVNFKDLQSKANLGGIYLKDLQSKGNVKTTLFEDLESKASLFRKVSNNLLSKGFIKLCYPYHKKPNTYSPKTNVYKKKPNTYSPKPDVYTKKPDTYKSIT